MFGQAAGVFPKVDEVQIVTDNSEVDIALRFFDDLFEENHEILLIVCGLLENSNVLQNTVETTTAVDDDELNSLPNVKNTFTGDQKINELLKKLNINIDNGLEDAQKKLAALHQKCLMLLNSAVGEEKEKKVEAALNIVEKAQKMVNEEIEKLSYGLLLEEDTGDAAGQQGANLSNEEMAAVAELRKKKMR